MTNVQYRASTALSYTRLFIKYKHDNEAMYSLLSTLIDDPFIRVTTEYEQIYSKLFGSKQEGKKDSRQPVTARG